MSANDLRKFMNVLNESFEAPMMEAVSKLTSVDEDFYVYAWESDKDKQAFDTWWGAFQTNEPYTAEEQNVPSEVVDSLVLIPAGTLSKLYGKRPNAESDRQAEAFENMVEKLRSSYGKFWDPDAATESVMETGNANAQQKGIHFSGKPASKNKGDMDLSSPKSKGPGSKTPLAQAKSGTNVGQKKA